MTPLWNPSPRTIQEANLTAFIRTARETWNLPGLSSFQDLYRWSIDYPEQFWRSVWRFCEIKADTEPRIVVEEFNQMPGARWFPGVRLNFAENLLRFADGHEAIVFWNEAGCQRTLTYQELDTQVAAFAAGLRATGVAKGDRVAGFMPNMPETVVAMLATASIGALWSSCSPDFGLAGALDRFGQVQPKVLVTADGYFYGGKTHDSLARVSRLRGEVPSIERVVVVPYTRPDPALDGLGVAELYEDFVSRQPISRIQFEQLPFDHPVYIMYSSGTTGPPKCIVHGAGGTLIQHLKELVLHTDLKREDRIFYFSTCGWMMWNWLVSSLAVGATIVLYDGSPFHPEPVQLFDMAEQERLTIFGASAKYIAAAEKAGVQPAATHDLTALRTVLSTGSPLAPENFDYVYEKVKRDVCLASISGGTDLISCFALGNPIGPVYSGELQSRGLGMKVEVFDEEGQALEQGKGELVCTAPFPSMPVGFWNDPDGRKYRSAYFERFPGVWHHGDYCELTAMGGMVFWGRSDAVLNPGGVRIGTAEIYRAVEKLPEVSEALAVGQVWQSDIRVILFVTLRQDLILDEQLAQSIKRGIHENVSPQHVPAKVIQVADLPRTLSGKISELAVRNVIHGWTVKNRDTLSNPRALNFFKDLPELRT